MKYIVYVLAMGSLLACGGPKAPFPAPPLVPGTGNGNNPLNYHQISINGSICNSTYSYVFDLEKWTLSGRKQEPYSSPQTRSLSCAIDRQVIVYTLPEPVVLQPSERLELVSILGSVTFETLTAPSNTPGEMCPDNRPHSWKSITFYLDQATQPSFYSDHGACNRATLINESVFEERLHSIFRLFSPEAKVYDLNDPR